MRDGFPAIAGLLLACVCASSWAGGIAGRVTDSETGLGFAAQVSIYDEGGTFIDFVNTDGNGNYLTEGAGAFPTLATGTYFAKTFNFFGYFNKLYDGVEPCTELSCPITSGTAIQVTEGVITADINFSLEPGGAIVRGRVTDAMGVALAGTQTVVIYDEAGTAFTRTFDAGAGYVTSEGLPPGIYYAGAFTAQDVAHGLFGGRPCLNAICFPHLSEPIFVASGAQVANVNFMLEAGGSIGGVVLDEDADGGPAPASGIGVSLYDPTLNDGAFGYIGTSVTGDDGVYLLRNVPPGTYYVSTGSFLGFEREIYDDIVCTGDCNPSIGTMVVVGDDEDVTGIDFGLGSGAHIMVGTITDAEGRGIGGIDVEVYDVAGDLFGFGRTGGAGGYGISGGLPDGTYFVKASDAFSRYVAELHGDLSCPQSCDPTNGQAIVLTGGGGTTETIDLQLERDRVFRNSFGF